jgi:hypothetical protein
MQFVPPFLTQELLLMPENEKLKTINYQIRIEGLLEEHWSEWLEGMTIKHEQKKITVLTGSLYDQPALHGVLHKIRDLGLVLISVTRFEIEE